MKKVVLSPIKVDKPPRHTQIEPRCLTCTKHPVCRIREDYIKTALAIQEILGDPQDDYELCCRGQKVENANEIFPATIIAGEEEYNFKSAIFIRPDSFELSYATTDDYEIKIIVLYQETKYTLSQARHCCHMFDISSESQTELLAAASKWREENYVEPEPKEFINTTYFSAILNCQFYEHERGLTPEQGYKRMFCNCDCEDDYHHLATLH